MNTQTRYVRRASMLALLCATFLTSALAVAQPPAGGRPPHGPPPQAAFDACNGKQADDACQLTMGEHTMNGKCAATPDARLACRPEPPPEMSQACEGKAEGDTCSVHHGDRGFDGTCHAGREGKLVCRPS